jgi:putative membrane-bound dehydrogenase-like protein
MTGNLQPRLRTAAWLILALASAAGAARSEERWVHGFERIQLSDVFYAEGATFGDVSGDGIPDIIAGPFWYEGPDFKKRHEYYEPKPFDIKGYSDNFFAFLYDFNRDGWNDIFIIGFPGKESSWYENPRGRPGHWKRHIVFDATDNESPTFADITGDGKPELVCQTGGRFGYAEFDAAAPEKKWVFTPISEDRKLGRFTHGMGVGDVDGDGRLDVLEKSGWYEQPASLAESPLWKHHPHPFAPGVGGAQMYAYDFDGDGDNDVLTSLNAHGWGLVWHENIQKDGRIDFVEHKIMGKEPQENPYGVAVPQLHAIDLIDMDGDGLKDIVTGKRIWAHYGEPSAEKPAEIWWFKLTRKEGKVDFIPYLMDGDSGVGTQVVAGDFTGDKLPDVVVSNKLGTFLLIHQRKAASLEEWRAAQPRRLANAGLSPREAAEAMTVPPGFGVELVAGEPDLHQPVALTIDERGRLWVAEAYTYPNRVKGHRGRWDEGHDKILIFEDVDGDGRFETRKTFAENLNLASGLEVGFGGVWVGAAPYLLFFPDRNGDDRPDGPPEILLDGWGFQDTHETLNSFIWGPDGWLYGCHGVFTHSLVGKPGTPEAERIPINAGVWRYHPTRHQFEVFAWGTSNPWGIDFDDRGQAFLTACVIPHLYHVVQGGRYQRQGGRHFDEHFYDDLKTIAQHLHYSGRIQDHAWWGHEPEVPKDTLAAGGGHAHCGAMVYLGDNFPESYRNTIFMHNIHGNRVNNDILERRGSGFTGKHGKDFLLANDKWFRGISLKYGPDGGVYLIDWYDKNACHRTQPEIWDRSSGRLYKATYGTPEPARVDLAALDDVALANLVLHPNDWHVRQARRLLMERGGSPRAHQALVEILRNHPEPERRLRALWALHASGGLSEDLALSQLASPHEHVRAWTVQLLAESRQVSRRALASFEALGRGDPSPVVRLYLASALQRLPLASRWGIAEGLLARGEDAGDHNLPLMTWYGIEPLAATDPRRALAMAERSRIELLARFSIRRVASRVDDLEPIMAALLAARGDSAELLILDEMSKAFEGRANLRVPEGWSAAFEKLARTPSRAVEERIQALAVKFGDRRIFPHLRGVLADGEAAIERRRHALEILLDGKDREAIPVLQQILAEPALRVRALKGLAAFDDPSTPGAVLGHYGALPAAEKLDAIQTLSSRPSYGIELLEAVREGRVPRTDLGAFTIRQLRSFKDERLDQAIEEVWGKAREASEDKLELIAEHRKRLTPAALKGADLQKGRAIFHRSCQQCHMLFGAGGTIGPEITGSDRANLDYILENIIDPSAVAGKDYLMNQLVLKDGRIASGLILKETESAFTVRTINEEVVVAKEDILQNTLSSLSLMPEDLLAPLTGDEVRDLIAYLASPHQVLLPGAAAIDPATKKVPGAIEGEALKVLRRTGGSSAAQGMESFGRDLWSGNSQLWWTGGRPGDRLELAIPVEKDGTYRLEAALTRARDYGVVQLWLDGKKIEGAIDLYNPAVVTTGAVLLAELPLEKGEHVLAVEILGANPQAVKAYMFGLDYVLLAEVR